MKKHICIDFEGEGKRRDGTTPHPSLLGALVPDLAGTKKKYFLWVFENEFAPITKPPRIEGKLENRKCCDLQTAISDLIQLANERECRLVSYSQHELETVRRELTPTAQVSKEFEALYFNIKRKATALARKRKAGAEDKTLDSLIKALMPKHKFPPPPPCGAAEACRRLRKAGAQSKRWRNWKHRHQVLAQQLIKYNRGDCVAVWKLVNRVNGNYNIAALRGPDNS